MKSNDDKPSAAGELKLDHSFHCGVDCGSLDGSGRALEHTIGLRLRKTAGRRRTWLVTYKAIKFNLAQSIRLFTIQAAIETLNRHNSPKNESLDCSSLGGYCCLEVRGYRFCGMDGHGLRK